MFRCGRPSSSHLTETELKVQAEQKCSVRSHNTYSYIKIYVRYYKLHNFGYFWTLGGFIFVTNCLVSGMEFKLYCFLCLMAITFFLSQV